MRIFNKRAQNDACAQVLAMINGDDTWIATLGGLYRATAYLDMMKHAGIHDRAQHDPLYYHACHWSTYLTLQEVADLYLSNRTQHCMNQAMAMLRSNDAYRSRRHTSHTKLPLVYPTDMAVMDFIGNMGRRFAEYPSRNNESDRLVIIREVGDYLMQQSHIDRQPYAVRRKLAGVSVNLQISLYMEAQQRLAQKQQEEQAVIFARPSAVTIIRNMADRNVAAIVARVLGIETELPAHPEPIVMPEVPQQKKKGLPKPTRPILPLPVMDEVEVHPTLQ